MEAHELTLAWTDRVASIVSAATNKSGAHKTPPHAVSRNNVELVNQAYDALNRRDLDASLGLMDADVEGLPTVVTLDGDVRGQDGLRRWYASVVDVFPDFTLAFITVRDLGGLTLATLRFRGHGAGSDTPFEMTLWSAAEWRERKCIWWGNYRTEADALEAVGLRE
jgi:hypothetical protein